LPKRIFLILLAILIGGHTAWAAPDSKVLGVREQLPNGLVWVFSRQTELPLVTMELLVKAGVLRDPPGKEGLANLTASLLLSGTKTLSAAQIAQQVDFLGARLGGGGGDDFTTLSLTVLKKNLAPALELCKEVLLAPAFAPEEMKRKVGQIKASLESEEDEPMVVATRDFARELFGPFPYGHPVRGTAAGLSAITRKDVVDFHRTYYRPNNAILSLVGDLTQDEARQWVTKTLGAWTAAPIPTLKLPPVPPLKESKVTVLDKDITQANIILGNMAIARANPDFYPLQVMNYILGGGGFSSRLLDDIRVNRGLAYSVSSSFDPGLEPGPFHVSLETKNSSAGEAITQVLAEMQRIRTQPVTPEELKDAKSYLIGSFPRKMDSMSKRAGLMAYVEAYGLGLDYPWRYPDLIQHLSAADIQSVAEKYLHPEAYLLVVVGKKSAMGPLPGVAVPKKEEKKDEK
jgi:zinc protease